MSLLYMAIILAGFAVLVGVGNLLLVHVNKIGHKRKGAAYSFILIIALVTTLVLGLLAPFQPKAAAAFSDTFNVVQLPVEASLMALLAITLTYASIRLLRRQLNLFSVIFLITAVLVLLGTAPWPLIGEMPFLSKIVRPFIAQIPATAGARGILLGVALGTLTTGLRVLFGADRPYGGK
ncbi:MAG: hypothetical protein ABIF04_05820 [Chloroflexota bacterium]